MEAADRIDIGMDIDVNNGNATPEIAETASVTDDSTKRSWKEALLHEIRTHPFGYVVVGLFVRAGP